MPLTVPLVFLEFPIFKKMYYIDHNYIASRNDEDLGFLRGKLACLKRECICCEAVPAFYIYGTLIVGHLGRRVWCIRAK